MPRSRLVAALVALLLASACAAGPVVITARPPAPPTCPAEGCDPSRATILAAARAPDACPSAGEAPCAGASGQECRLRALSAWTEAQDDRGLACVASTLSEACALDDAPACGFAGRLWLDGHGVARDPQRGLGMLMRACDGGVALACMVGVRWLALPEHVRDAPDGPQLRTRLDAQHGCLSSLPDDCFRVGLDYYYGREAFPRDRARSAEAYGRGCDLGHGIACNNLGDALEYGEGVPRDLSRAAAAYERACHIGEALGCSNLGHLLEHGEGVPRDVGRARVLYRDACASGDVYGCLHGDMLAALDAGSTHDARRALEAWRRACDARDARACAFVGVVYEDGPDGLARDESKSLQAMTRACDLGHRRACDWMKVHPGP